MRYIREPKRIKLSPSVCVFLNELLLFRFLGSEDQDTYFTNIQRHQIVSKSLSDHVLLFRTVVFPTSYVCSHCAPIQVYEILARTVYGKRKRTEVGVDRLVNEGAYTAAYPLHEVRGRYLLFNLKGKVHVFFYNLDLIYSIHYVNLLTRQVWNNLEPFGSAIPL